MKFKFRLQAVLDLKQRNEDLAKVDYQLAQAEVNRCLAEIREMYEQVGQTRQFVNTNEQSKQAGQVSNLQISHEFIEGQKLKIERKRLQARSLMQVAEQKMEVFRLAMQERKAIEKLKEKRWEEFKKEKKKKEEAFFDDLMILRFGRKAK